MTTILSVCGFVVVFGAACWVLDVPVNREGLRFREYWSQCPLWHDPEEGAWRPIETAPRDGTRVLTFARGYFAVGWNYDDGNGWQDMSDMIPEQPSHWVPLPAPPAG